jgi:hypothetical protein
LTRTNVSENVSELIDEGLVHEVGVGNRWVASRPSCSASWMTRYLIGLDLNTTVFMAS